MNDQNKGALVVTTLMLGLAVGADLVHAKSIDVKELAKHNIPYVLGELTCLAAGIVTAKKLYDCNYQKLGAVAMGAGILGIATAGRATEALAQDLLFDEPAETAPVTEAFHNNARLGQMLAHTIGYFAALRLTAL